MPQLIIIGGPNGSGKTTLSAYLTHKGRITSEIINPDEIALKELGSYTHKVQAARIALQRRNKAIDILSDFAIETTFSGITEINEIKKAKALGYTTKLYFISLSSVLDNINRVKERYTQYGHTVEITDIARRYMKSQIQLTKYINLFDTAYLFDNSGTNRSRVAVIESGELMWLNPKHRLHPFYKGLLNLPSSPQQLG